MNIKEARELAGFSLDEVSRMLGNISKQSISNIENGVIKYKPETEAAFRKRAAELYRGAIDARIRWLVSEADKLQRISDQLFKLEKESQMQGIIMLK